MQGGAAFGDVRSPGASLAAVMCEAETKDLLAVKLDSKSACLAKWELRPHDAKEGVCARSRSRAASLRSW